MEVRIHKLICWENTLHANTGLQVVSQILPNAAVEQMRQRMVKIFLLAKEFLINDCRTFQPVTCELSIQQKRVDVCVLVNVVAKHWETLLPFTVELKGLVKPTNMKETVPIIQVVSSVLEQ